MKNKFSIFIRLLLTLLATVFCLGAAGAALILPLRWLAREQEAAVGVVETRESLATGGLDEKAAADPLARSLYEHKQKAGLQRQDNELLAATDTEALWTELETLYPEALPNFRPLMTESQVSSGMLRDLHMGYEGCYLFFSGSQAWNSQDQYECIWHTDRTLNKLVKVSFCGGFPLAEVQEVFFPFLPEPMTEIEVVYEEGAPQERTDRGGAPPKPEQSGVALIGTEGEPIWLETQMNAPETAEYLLDAYMAYLGADPADYTAVTFGPWREETLQPAVCMRYSPAYQIYLYSCIYCHVFKVRGQEMAYIEYGFGACSLTEQELERALY